MEPTTPSARAHSARTSNPSAFRTNFPTACPTIRAGARPRSTRRVADNEPGELMAKAKKKAKKKLYLAVYLGKQSAMKKWDRLPAKARRERLMKGMQGWMGWATQ